MRLLVLASALSVAVASAAAGCSTYRSDLDRAHHHYDTNQFDKALALFRVLEDDMDSFSEAEKAQYAYLRGMTDYRLSGIAPQGSGVSDPRKGYRDNSRHWLGVAAAIEKKTPGGLNAEEKGRLTDTMKDLNRDVYGGADTAGEGEEPGADAGAAPPPELVVPPSSGGS
jgi:hypothetical protein